MTAGRLKGFPQSISDLRLPGALWQRRSAGPDRGSRVRMELLWTHQALLTAKGNELRISKQRQIPREVSQGPEPERKRISHFTCSWLPLEDTEGEYWRHLGTNGRQRQRDSYQRLKKNAQGLPAEQPSHLFSEVFFCQKDSPLYGLAQTLDNNLLFQFNFPASRWDSRLPELQPAVQNRTTEQQIAAMKTICDTVLPVLTKFSDKYIQIQIPEARGIPHVEVFTLQPLQLGQPNILVCSVRNIFPPVAKISWAFHDQVLTPGVSSTQVYPIQGLDFQIFSYLEVTPQADDVYSCTVKGPGDKFDSMAYWVPKDPIASKLLENFLFGSAIAVGGVFMILGLTLGLLSLQAVSRD
ncbi:class II histocompatibility antigen, M alpha chain [Python bivittatus]|uniref:Class II histocompatibility antigen, M alpha chain n=1 Tax=Python bivittatus TaxID=176946 RepID=A0A9F5N4T2_PYTBI|nr:class II histocompatibility antigen, M alpha chain [Python bivittatus]